jgi:hypothetical protein
VLKSQVKMEQTERMVQMDKTVQQALQGPLESKEHKASRVYQAMTD